MTTRIVRLASVIAIAGLAAGAAVAQVTGVFDMGALTATLGTDVLRQSEEARAAQGGRNNPTGTRSRTASDARVADPATLTFRYNPAARTRNQQRLVSRIAAVDPQGAADLKRAFVEKDLSGANDRQVRSMGLDPYNVADTTAIYLVTAWHGARGSTAGTPTEFRAVSRQLARSLSGSQSLGSASAIAKQEVAESMLVQSVLIEQAVTAAQRQPAAMPRVKQAIVQGTRKAFAFDISAKRLGPQGLQ